MSSAKASSVGSKMLLWRANLRRLTLWWLTADQWLRTTSTPSSKSMIYKKEKKDKLFADHVTQVCEAHNRVIVSFLQQVQGDTRPATEESRENIGPAQCARVRR